MLKTKALTQTIFNYGSLFQWALAGFILVIIPLVFAIVFTLIEVTHYTEKSQKTLFQTVKITENIRAIHTRLISMERSVRQFQVLKEVELLKVYQENREKLLDVLNNLKKQELEPLLIKNIEVLQETENKLYQDIVFNLKDNQLQSTEIDLNVFDQLSRQAKQLLSEGEGKVSKETNALSVAGQQVKEKLFISALSSIVVALFFALIFVNLLTRPIKRIRQAIHKLGETGFEKPIYIKGTHDLASLGERLEWLRQKLNQVELEKQQFIRNVSHELKTPLATLKEGADLLADNVVGELNSEQQEIVQLMKLGNIKINDLVDNLLEYQRTISTQVHLNYSVFDLKILITRITREYQLPILSKSIILKSNIGSIHIKADYDKLRIIISNLVSNAVKFSPKNSTLSLCLNLYQQEIQLKIEDQGPGITKEIEPLIFEDFYLGSSPGSWKIKGSGLGLALVRHYLDMHKGSIQLLPANKEYCGARFLLHLPQNMNA